MPDFGEEWFDKYWADEAREEVLKMDRQLDIHEGRSIQDNERMLKEGFIQSGKE